MLSAMTIYFSCRGGPRDGEDDNLGGPARRCSRRMVYFCITVTRYVSGLYAELTFDIRG